MTRELFRYLNDYATELAKQHVMSSYTGLPSADVAREQAYAHGVCTAFNEIVEIEYDQIHNFYNSEKEEEDVSDTEGDNP